MKLLPIIAVLLGLGLSSCSMLKSGYHSVAKGAGATWGAVASAGGAVANAGGSVVSGTANLGKKTTKLVTGGLGQNPTVAEITINLNGKRGVIVLQLDDELAPEHAKNFRKLVKEDYYAGLGVHRAVPGHLIQTGDPRSKHENARAVWGLGGPGYTVPAEIKLPHRRGSVGMARLGDRLNPTRQSNGSQFYICLKNMPELDGQYTVFAKVISGMEFADAISKTATDDNDSPLKMVKIEKVRMLESGAMPVVSAPAPAPEAAPMAMAAVAAPEAKKSKKVKSVPMPAAAPQIAPAPEKKKGWMGRLLDRVW